MRYSLSIMALATLLSGTSAMTYPRGAVPAELRGVEPRALYMCATEDCRYFEQGGRICRDSNDCNDFPYVLVSCPQRNITLHPFSSRTCFFPIFFRSTRPDTLSAAMSGALILLRVGSGMSSSRLSSDWWGGVSR
ncbi:hypothetical protein B0T16DRAFT_139694 [Cercophora newfieldiana]|uniref:Uncharacterized protein n=1 Tax=Cercophora newfieldiana TaxID=92897 RepID=A0AA40CNE7_9PEZI|nr:hypothetical protein B0T16DRAFT_139694 [Cercophora newfieldiana]